MENINLPLACALILPLGLIFLARRSRSSLKGIQGPPSSSWIYGHLRELLLASEYGEHEFKWQSQYGSLYKIKGAFGEDRLMVSDPGALKQILGDTETFARSDHQQQIVLSLIGEKSVFYVETNKVTPEGDHSRLRSIMNPAFSAVNIRALPPLFRNVSQRMIQKWEDKRAVLEPDQPMDVFDSLHDATLDAIGEAAVGYLFHAEKDGEEYARSHHNLVALSSSRSQVSILVDAILPLLPHLVRRALLYLPRPELRALRNNRKISAQVSTEFIKSKTAALQEGFGDEKDLLSVLVKANTSKGGVAKMTSLELSAQIPTVIVAGQGGSANTIAWALYELAKHPDFQHKLRVEISESGPPDGELSYADLEGMPLLNAFVKEVLRFHANLPVSERVATKDTVLQLSQPITSTTGEQLTSVPIKKGQFIFSALWSYNRLPTIWGPDADEFKPSRWLEGTPYRGQAMGPYSNLLTFLQGPRMCIGWRFAVTEVQVILTELVKRYSFELPPNVEIHCNLAVTLIPVTVDGADPALPLIVRRVE
ncbi:PAH-inducible cytochrome P450 monooxygenase PC-PAH 1 [Mycena capillaripes]|nr:PAH-inducible cytochrome P450 monooxygenase PC-PAH 1 [Mycena capillaripes]